MLLVAWHGAMANQSISVAHVDGTDVTRIDGAGAGKHTLEIDDAPGFAAPVATIVFQGSSTKVHGNQVGIIPGLTYYFRVDHFELAQPLRILDRNSTPDGDGVSCSMLHNNWELSARFDIGTALSGLKWVGNHWAIAPHSYLLGESLYNVEMLMRPAIAAARACNDREVLDQIAQYYNIMLSQTETVGQLLARPVVTAETRSRLASANSDARTFSAKFSAEAGEGELYLTQWLHPAALMVRLVTTLPENERTPAMREFAAKYASFIVKDQLNRYLYEETLPPLGGVTVRGRVARWEQAMHGLRGGVPWDTAMSDIDLWLLASAVEILGAHANDPQLVVISDSDARKLREAVSVGIRFFQSKRTVHPDTKNFEGTVVGSASYFDGDYVAHSDFAFSAVETESLPDAAERKVNPKASWDISHVYRLPIFLRALYENRNATGENFPQMRDLELVVNEYVYKVFTGDFTKPQFRNNFDGCDGWFRVDYNGQGFGYPPSSYCDMRNPKRPCMMPGAVIGWPELQFVNRDLRRLEASLLQLAAQTDPSVIQFRDRHYFSNGSPYKTNVIDGRALYGGALYMVAAEDAELCSDTARTEAGQSNNF